MKVEVAKRLLNVNQLFPVLSALLGIDDRCFYRIGCGSKQRKQRLWFWLPGAQQQGTNSSSRPAMHALHAVSAGLCLGFSSNGTNSSFRLATQSMHVSGIRVKG